METDNKESTYTLSPDASALFLQIKEQQRILQLQMDALIKGAGLGQGEYVCKIVGNQVELTIQ